MDETQEQQNHTFLMQENDTQLAWLLNLDTNLTRAMGGVFPERNGDVTGIHDVLDLACGAGGWALEIAHLYPHIQVTGVDTNKHLIEKVSALATTRKIPNAHYQITNILLLYLLGHKNSLNTTWHRSGARNYEWLPYLITCFVLLARFEPEE